MKWENIGKLKYLFGVLLIAGLTVYGCSKTQANGVDPNTIESKYGLTGARAENVMTPDGPMAATVVPITMENGEKAELVIPQKTMDAEHPAFIRDTQGLHPIALSNRRPSRDQIVRSGPSVVAKQPVAQHRNKRSWEKEALIIGGSAGAGAAIGGAAAGGKGAAVGAMSGGVGGLIYDLLTKNK